MASNAYIGAIFMFGGTFAPRGYAFCNGQLVAIQSNTALFALIGTTYGGNGTSTFGLPDFRGRVPISWGQGPGLSNYVLGEETGTETVQLLSTQMPSHNHQISVGGQQTSDLPQSAYLAAGGAYASSPATGAQLAGVSFAGSNAPHNNLQPLLAVSFIICTQGIFPSRN